MQPAFAQNIGSNSVNADSTMAWYLKRISYWASATKYAPEESDSLIDLNRKLMGYVINFGGNADNLTARFPRSEALGLISMASDDNKLKLYAWDTWTGNTMHYFNAVAQYSRGNGAGVKILNDISDTTKTPDPGAYVTEINTVHTSDGKVVYLVTDCTVASKNEKATGIKAYTIENGELKNLSFFKTKKLITNYIDLVYNISYDPVNSFVSVIHFSADKKELFIPVVSADGRLANKYWVYVFNGEMYVFKKQSKGI